MVVWDVAAGVAQCEIQEHAKPIQGEECAVMRAHVHVLTLAEVLVLVFLSFSFSIHLISSLPG
jgi:hypothetical protein